MDETGSERLRQTLLTVGDEELRAGLAALPRALQQKVADEARTKVPVLLRGRPSRFLERLTSALLLQAVADVVTADCFDETEELLGDSWEDPSQDELVAVVDELLERYPAPVVATMLASVVASDAPAAPICAELLDDDPRFADLGAGAADAAADPEPGTAQSTGAAGQRPRKEASPEQREARRRRKEEERERKRKEQERAAAARRARKREAKAKPTRPGAPTGPPDAPSDPPTPTGSPGTTTRRRPRLSDADAKDFRVDDPLVGRVVIAEIFFDGEDPEQPELDRKRRPCVVIAASRHHVLVRAGYSEGGFKSRTWKSVQLQDWQEAGLERASFIEAKPRRIPRANTSPPIGELSDRDWNALW